MYAVNFIWHVQVAMIKCRFCSHMAQTRHWDVRRAPLSGSTQVMHIGACIHICTIIYIHINNERERYIYRMVGIYIYIYTPNIDLHFFSFHPAPPGCPRCTGCHLPSLPENYWQARRAGGVSGQIRGFDWGIYWGYPLVN